MPPLVKLSSCTDAYAVQIRIKSVYAKVFNPTLVDFCQSFQTGEDPYLVCGSNPIVGLGLHYFCSDTVNGTASLDQNTGNVTIDFPIGCDGERDQRVMSYSEWLSSRPGAILCLGEPTISYFFGGPPISRARALVDAYDLNAMSYGQHYEIVDDLSGSPDVTLHSFISPSQVPGYLAGFGGTIIAHNTGAPAGYWMISKFQIEVTNGRLCSVRYPGDSGTQEKCGTQVCELQFAPCEPNGSTPGSVNTYLVQGAAPFTVKLNYLEGCCLDCYQARVGPDICYP